MIGSKFGMLEVLRYVESHPKYGKKYLCKCDCGNETIVIANNLYKQNSTSCGCVRRKKSSVRMGLLNLKHGKTQSKEWKTWKGIVERTTSKKSSHYSRYGGAGIGIHKDWLIFDNFYSYIGDAPSQNHSIDRIDNANGYFPGNIRWATSKQQASNRKTNVFVVIDDEKMISSDAAKKMNVSKSTIGRWIKSGKIKKVS